MHAAAQTLRIELPMRALNIVTPKMITRIAKSLTPGNSGTGKVELSRDQALVVDVLRVGRARLRDMERRDRSVDVPDEAVGVSLVVDAVPHDLARVVDLGLPCRCKRPIWLADAACLETA